LFLHNNVLTREKEPIGLKCKIGVGRKRYIPRVQIRSKNQLSNFFSAARETFLAICEVFLRLKLFYNAIYLLVAYVNHEILDERFSLMIIICIKAYIIKSVLRDDMAPLS